MRDEDNQDTRAERNRAEGTSPPGRRQGCIHIHLALWGPDGSGRRASLGILHDVCPASARGGLVHLENGQGRAGAFDYAVLDLPAWNGHAIRLHGITVPEGTDMGEEQARLLRMSDAVLFTANVNGNGHERSAASWARLQEHLSEIGEAATLPLAILLGGTDPAREQREGTDLSREIERLTGGHGRHRIIAVGRADLARGVGVLPPVQQLVAEALLRCDPRAAPDRESYRTRLSEYFKPAASDRAAAAATEGSPKTTSAGTTPISQWMRLRDLDLRQLERERALRRLLLRVGGLCAAGTDLEDTVRVVLRELLVGLDARTGWVGLSRASGRQRIYDVAGLAPDGAAVGEAARRLAPGLHPLRPRRIDADVAPGFEGAGSDGIGLFVTFDVGNRPRGWLLLDTAAPGDAAQDAELILPAAAVFLGLAVSRIEAVGALREAKQSLERKIAGRTEELRMEKEGLEVRVRERTRQLEAAKRAALDSERRLLDRERVEGVHQLAAGLAHELNNPLGAIRASLEFLKETLDDVGPGRPVSAVDLEDLLEAVTDSLTDADRIAKLVETQFGNVVMSRRAAHRTDLNAALQDGVRHFRAATPGGEMLTVEPGTAMNVGIPPGELTRWIFRVLTALASSDPRLATVSTQRHDGHPVVQIRVAASLTSEARKTIEGVGTELQQAGGRLDAVVQREEAMVRLRFPAGLGESASPRVEEVER